MQIPPVPDTIAAPDTFTEQFLALYDALVSYLFRLTTNRADAEDLAQTTYLKAVQRFDQFEGQASFKTWVFAIATNLARDHFRARRRWFEDSQDRCRETTQAATEKVAAMHALVDQGDAEAYEFREHIDYCFTCLAKTLLPEQQVALILKEIYRFRVSDITVILGLSEGQVKHALANGRHTMRDIFDRRCTLVSKQGVCHQCSEMAGFVNTKHDAQVAANRLRLVQAARDGADRDRLFALRTALIQHLDPLTAPMASLHEFLLRLMDETAEAQHNERDTRSAESTRDRG